MSVERSFTREYRQGTTAAHLFGNVGEVTAEQLREPRYSGLRQGIASGSPGSNTSMTAFPAGQGGDRSGAGRCPRSPDGRAAEQARGGGRQRQVDDRPWPAGLRGGALRSFGLPGAFVAMDVNDGSILAMGSTPTFDPAIFTRPITQRQYRSLTSEKTDPLANRAIQGLYPTGSVFKMITGTAALEHEPDLAEHDLQRHRRPRKIDVQTLRNAGKAGVRADQHERRVQGIVRRLLLFARLECEGVKGHGQIQDWARRYGLGGSGRGSTCRRRSRG